LLIAPSLYLSLKYLQEYGLSTAKISGRLFLSLFAALLLVGHVLATVGGRLGEILAADFFPSRGFLIFMVSGFAYGAAIFPKLLVETHGPLKGSFGSGPVWLVAISAWLWILILILLGAVYHAS